MQPKKLYAKLYVHHYQSSLLGVSRNASPSGTREGDSKPLAPREITLGLGKRDKIQYISNVV